ncbi:hypothetical protein VKT23_018399 [Stygiomarasmius scandens]|uniref:Uncharacterized protein n=1 Tax=Marasmiellus scandens TaxID=2682957 RepID=A0ABR1IP32_9AGAR
MALGYWLFVLLYSPIAWAMQLSTSQSTVTVGQPVTVMWSLNDTEKANLAVGILVIFDGDDPQKVAQQLEPNGEWLNNVVYGRLWPGKTSPSGSFSSEISRSGNFYFGGYIIVLPHKRRDGSSDHHPVFLSEIGRSPPMTAVSPDSSQIPHHPGPDTGTPATSGSSSAPALPSASATIQGEDVATNDIASQSTHTGAPAASESSLGNTTQLETLTSTKTSITSVTASLTPGSGTTHDPLGVIFGSIFGTLAFLALLASILFWIRRRRAKRNVSQRDWLFKNPQYWKGDTANSLSAKRMSLQSSDWDDGSIAPSDSISQVHGRIASRRKPVPPSTVLTALTEETEKTLVTEVSESKTKITHDSVRLGAQGYGFSISEDKDKILSSDTPPSHPNIPVIIRTSATTIPSTVMDGIN